MLSPTGFEPVGRAIGNLKQDALLPAIALILLGFFLSPRPTPSPQVPPRTTLEGHTEGTCQPRAILHPLSGKMAPRRLFSRT
jgi:hypothetical protein